MESIWVDLTRDEQSFAVPDWHVWELRATERRISEGEAFFEDWSEMKRRLRD